MLTDIAQKLKANSGKRCMSGFNVIAINVALP
jgi:hypothetical protein